MKEWEGEYRTTSLRFIFKKKIQVYTYVHRLAIEGYMRNYSFLDLQHLYTLHM